MTSIVLPQPGQLVEVRDRLFLVTNVAGNEPTGDAVPRGSNGPTHVVKLLSLEEDAFGDVLEIMWENEPGIRVRERPGLPDLASTNDPNGSNAVLNAVLWGVVDFVRRGLGKVAPAVDRETEIAMLDGRLDLDTFWTETEVEPLARRLIEEGVLEGHLEPQIYWANKEVGALGRIPRSESPGRDHIRRLKKRLKEAKTDISAAPSRLRLVVEVALDLAGQPPLKPVTLDGEPVDSNSWTEDLVFLMPGLHGDWAECAKGLEHPDTGKVRPITFDHKTAAETDDVVLCHLNHPLVRMSLGVLRAEMWAGKEEQKLSRFQIAGIDEHQCGNMAIVHALLLVTGGSGQLLHQELIHCGVELDGVEVRPQMIDWRRVEYGVWTDGDEADFPEVRRWFAERWTGSVGFETALMRGLDAQVEKRMKSIQASLMKRRKEENRARINPLREMALAIRRDIKAEQRDENVATLRARLEPLESEIERGALEIKDRYSNFRTWVFPAAMALAYPVEIRYP